MQTSRRKDALAIKNSIDEVEKMLRAPDNSNQLAESSDDLEESEKWLERAIYSSIALNKSE
jgi:hypothetical protein